MSESAFKVLVADVRKGHLTFPADSPPLPPCELRELLLHDAVQRLGPAEDVDRAARAAG